MYYGVLCSKKVLCLSSYNYVRKYCRCLQNPAPGFPHKFKTLYKGFCRFCLVTFRSSPFKLLNHSLLVFWQKKPSQFRKFSTLKSVAANTWPQFTEFSSNINISRRSNWPYTRILIIYYYCRSFTSYYQNKHSEIQVKIENLTTNLALQTVNLKLVSSSSAEQVCGRLEISWLGCTEWFTY